MRQSCLLSLLVIQVLHLSSCQLKAESSDTVYQAFLQCLQSNTNTSEQITKIVYAQSNASYSSVLQAYIRNARLNYSSTPKPLLIVTPMQQSHVQAAVLCSKQMGFHIRIRSGGHDFEGLSYISDTPFFIVDMYNMRSIEIDVNNETAWVQAGTILGELYFRIWEKTKVHGFPAGVCPTVGVGGHFSGGGYGNLFRKYGLSVDNIIDAKLVDVNGTILDRTAMGEDLFWAIRGGGGASFGVILAYKIKLVRVPEKVTVFGVQKTLEENVTDMVYRWQFVAPTTSNKLFMSIRVKAASSNSSTIIASLRGLYLGDADSLVSLLDKEFPELGLRRKDCQEISWIDSVLFWASYGNGTSPGVLALRRFPAPAKFGKRKSDFVEMPISKAGLDWIWKKMIELGNIGLLLIPYGGKMSEIPGWETPFPHRAGNLFMIEYSVNWAEKGSEAERKYMTEIRMLYSYMTPFVSKNPRRAYLNYRDLDIGMIQGVNSSYVKGKDYGYKYFYQNFDRLVKVKSKVDPDNFFRNEQCIPTIPSEH